MTTQSLHPPLDTGWCGCTDRRRRVHHDRLLLVETHVDELLELLELAVTWSELDYSETPVVPPEHWTEFAATHTWREPGRMQRLFGLAADIALRSGSGSRGTPGAAAGILDLVAR